MHITLTKIQNAETYRFQFIYTDGLTHPSITQERQNEPDKGPFEGVQPVSQSIKSVLQGYPKPFKSAPWDYECANMKWPKKQRK
jgi:hypothetical protein